VSLLVFVHVPRTGGTTLQHVISDRYPPDRVLAFEDPARVEEEIAALSPEARDRVEAVLGHVHHGVHEHFDRPARYLTMLRHPVARIVSHFRYARSNPRHYLHAEVVERGFDLVWYARGELSDELRNGQVRMFSPSESLEEAKQVLAEFDVVGLTERFDESLLLMQDALGWTTPYYARENRGPAAGEPLTEEALAAIEAANPLDFALYDFAEGLLARRIEAKPEFAERLERFRRRNRVLGPATRLRRLRRWRG
jgi:hypothetical protein